MCDCFRGSKALSLIAALSQHLPAQVRKLRALRSPTSSGWPSNHVDQKIIINPCVCFIEQWSCLIPGSVVSLDIKRQADRRSSLGRH